MTARLLLQVEPGCGHSGFELRGVAEEKRVQDEIAVSGVGSDREIGGARVE